MLVFKVFYRLLIYFMVFLYFDGEFLLGEVSLVFFGFFKSFGGVFGRKMVVDGMSLFGVEVEGEVFFVFVEEVELSVLFGVDDG